jgi:modulator of FtsH protease HflC
MNRIKLVAVLAVLGIGTYVVMSSIYTVSEVEQAIITQFGDPVGAPVTTAGLKVKVPFIQDVNLIEKRVLEWDGNPSDMPTKDKLYVSVDLFARWRIVDPLQYFLRLHDERSAQSRLDDVLGSETRNAVAKHELIEIIRTTKDRVPLRDTLVTNAVRELDVASLVPTQKGRKLVEQEIFGEAAEKVRVFGIELLDIRFKRINRQNMSAAAAPFAESGHRAPRRWCRPTGPEGDEERRLSIQGCRDGPSSSSRR